MTEETDMALVTTENLLQMININTVAQQEGRKNTEYYNQANYESRAAIAKETGFHF